MPYFSQKWFDLSILFVVCSIWNRNIGLHGSWRQTIDSSLVMGKQIAKWLKRWCLNLKICQFYIHVVWKTSHSLFSSMESVRERWALSLHKAGPEKHEGSLLNDLKRLGNNFYFYLYKDFIWGRLTNKQKLDGIAMICLVRWNLISVKRPGVGSRDLTSI